MTVTAGIGMKLRCLLAILFSFVFSFSVVIGLYVSEKTGNNILDITNWQECQMVVAFMF
jgi:hypothetical protein